MSCRLNKTAVSVSVQPPDIVSLEKFAFMWPIAEREQVVEFDDVLIVDDRPAGESETNVGAVTFVSSRHWTLDFWGSAFAARKQARVIART